MSDSVTQTPPPAPQPARAAAAERATPKRRRRWPRRIAVLLGLLLLAVYFAPTIVAKTALRNRIIRGASADLNGTLEAGDASLGWFSPVELRDVTLTDSQGRAVARVPKITSGRTLLGLAWDHSQLGEFTLDRPAIEIVCGKDGTNLEDVLRKFLDDTAPPGPTRTPVTVRVAGGTLTLKDADSDRTGEFRDLDALVTIPASRSEPIAAKVSANAPGRVDAELSIGEANRVKLAADGFALESLAPLLRRADPTLAVGGSLSAAVVVTWAKDSATADGIVGVQNLAVSSPALKGDTVRLAAVALPIKASLSGRVLKVEKADLTSDVGTVSIAGTFDPDEPLDKLLDRPGVKLDATVEVAKLAAALPKLLRVRDGTEFREGTVTVKLASKAGVGVTAWTGGVTTTALRATRGGKDIRWDEPLTVKFAGRAKAGELPTIDDFTCESEFIAVRAAANRDSVRAAANIVLDKLAERLSGFLDLAGVTLDGRGSAKLIASRTPAGDFKANASLDLTQFAVIDRGGKGIREPELKLQVAASGRAPDGGPVSIATATGVLTAGADELHLTLLEAIPDAQALGGGKLDARLVGDLGRWRTRFAAALPLLDDYTLGGNATAHGVVRFTPGMVNVDRLTLAIEKARFVGAGLDLAEPQMNGVADLTIDRTAGTATFADFTINSAPLSVTRGKLVIESPSGGPLVVYGGGPSVTDLNRLGRTVGMFDPRGPYAMSGKGTGPVRFRYMGDVTTFGGHLDITNFASGPKDAPDWTEAKMRLELDGSYTRSTDTVAFKAAKLDRPGFGLAVAGSIGKFDTTTDVNLAGDLTYDLAKLSPALRETIGGDFTATGTGTKPVSIAGSLTPLPKPGSKTAPSALASLNAELAIGWDSAKAYGFDLGSAELRAKLADGVGRVNPIHATFGGGKVSLHPTLKLDPVPGELTFEKGLIIDRAKLTPAVCAGALGYALPAIANAGRAEGEISVNLDNNRIPLGDARKAHIRSTVTIHKATVSAGPVVTEIAKLLGADGATMTLAQEQSVLVRVVNGRVQHDSLALKIGAYTVKTSGWVGLDGNLDIVADVPIPGGLPGLKNTPALAKALTGKRVNVPIKGTMDRPMLDPKAFQAAIAALAQDAAKDIGKDVLGRELEKLFPGGVLPKAGSGGFFPFGVPKK